MLDGLSDVSLSSEEDSVGSGWGSEGKLVKSQSLSTGSSDSLSGRGGEFKGSDRELWDLGKSLVVKNGSDDNNSLGVVWVGSSGLLDNSGKGDWGSVDLQSEHNTSKQAMVSPCS